MTKSLKIAALLGIAVLGGLPVSASDAVSMRVHVPFSFVVGTQEFMAGDYVIRKDSDGVVMIYGRDQAIAVISTPSSSAEPSAMAALRFLADDTGEHLSKVDMMGEPERTIPVHGLRARRLTVSR